MCVFAEIYTYLLTYLLSVKLACIPYFSFLNFVEVTCPVGWVSGWLDGWPGSDNMTISVQLDLT